MRGSMKSILYVSLSMLIFSVNLASCIKCNSCNLLTNFHLKKCIDQPLQERTQCDACLKIYYEPNEQVRNSIEVNDDVSKNITSPGAHYVCLRNSDLAAIPTLKLRLGLDQCSDDKETALRVFNESISLNLFRIPHDMLNVRQLGRSMQRYILKDKALKKSRVCVCASDLCNIDDYNEFIKSSANTSLINFKSLIFSVGVFLVFFCV